MSKIVPGPGSLGGEPPYLPRAHDYYPGDLYGGRGEPAAFDWRQYLIVLRRRLWPALTVFVIALVAGIVHGFTRVPVYEAKVRLLVSADRPNITGLTDPLSAAAAIDNDVQTQLTMLQSRSLARRTLESLGERQVPRPAPVATNGADTSGEADKSDDAGELTVPTADEGSAAIDGFLGGVRVAQIPNSRLIDVFYRSVDPNVAANYANALATEFTEQNIENRTATSEDLSDWLDARMAEQLKTLEESTRALQEYRERNGVIVAREQSDLTIQSLTELTAAYTKAKTDRIAKEAVFTQLEALAKRNAPVDEIPSLLVNPALQQLRLDLGRLQEQEVQLAGKLGDRHPSLIAAREAVKSARQRLEEKATDEVRVLRQEYFAARDVEAKLEETLETQRRESLALNRSDVELAVLERAAESNRQIYDNLLQRMNEFAVTRQGRSNNVRIVDPAEVPKSPTGSAAWTDVRYGALGGFVLALLVAFGLEQADNRIKTPQQIKELGFPVLGMVPQVAVEGDQTRPLLSEKGDTNRGGALLTRLTSPVFSEAFRGIRTNVRLSIAVDGGRSVIVTSPRAGEGKTVVASNLAVTLALADQRVLLIDADMRRPSLHRMFGVSQSPGLSDLLVSQSQNPPPDVVRHLGIANLHLLTCGTTPPNPSSFLESRRFAEFLARSLREFDWVVIDTPPVLPVTDASILAAKTNGVVFVVSAEQSPMPSVEGALEQLQRTKAHVLGVVLNRIDLQRRGYYYNEYYSRDYDKYYASSAS